MGLFENCVTRHTNFQDKKIADLLAQISKGFSLEDGPFVKALDSALKSFKVERQAYYGGTFVGNHVHKTLKVWWLQ